MTGSGRRQRTVWAAWRVARDGSLEVSATVETGDGHERERWDYPTLEAAAADLGESFREVVGNALAEGHRQGRWRP